MARHEAAPSSYLRNRIIEGGGLINTNSPFDDGREPVLNGRFTHHAHSRFSSDGFLIDFCLTFEVGEGEIVRHPAAGTFTGGGVVFDVSRFRPSSEGLASRR